MTDMDRSHRRRLYTPFAVACIMGLFIGTSYGRINILEPWYPGQDPLVGAVDSYEARVGLIGGEYLLEVPVEFDYVALPQLEVGGRWGIRSVREKTGISDLLLGFKYQLLDGSDDRPYVLGEAAMSLPTADYRSGLGTGAVSFLLHWSLLKDIEKVTASLGFGVQMNSENPDHVRAGSVFFYHTGARYPYRKDLVLHAELKGFNHARSSTNGAENVGSDYQELYIAPGADYWLDQDRILTGSLLIGLTPESHDLGILLTTRF